MTRVFLAISSSRSKTCLAVSSPDFTWARSALRAVRASVALASAFVRCSGVRVGNGTRKPPENEWPPADQHASTTSDGRASILRVAQTLPSGAGGHQIPRYRAELSVGLAWVYLLVVRRSTCPSVACTRW